MVQGLLIRDCPATRPEPTTPAQSEETTPPAAPQNTAPLPSSPEAEQGAPVTSPLTVDEELMAELPSISQVQSMRQRNERTALAYAPYMFPTVNGQQADVLGASSVPIQTSAEGWRFWGVAWYWWAVVTVVALGSWAIMRRSIYARDTLNR